jgi:predicted DsbA family dithiol-disulfide isomerase
MPDAKKENAFSMDEMLSERYGRSVKWAKQMNEQVSNTAKEAGLNFNLAKAHFTNTLDAHKLIHLAKKHGVQDQAKEKLLSAYFVEGIHIGRLESLIKIGEELGLPKEELTKVLESNEYEKEITQEIREGQKFGLTGVPFFVFNRKYAISGAQPSKVFLDLLNSIWKDDFSNETDSSEKNSCSIDGNC